MTADIKQIDFSIRDQESQCKTVTKGDADCLHPLEFTAKVMVSKVRLKRVSLQLAENCRKFFSQILMLLEKLGSLDG